MESIIATAVIQGKQYRLAPKTINVQREIDEIVRASNDIMNGKSEDYEALISKQLDFIRNVAGCHVFDAAPIESIDMDDLNIACIAVVNGYKDKVKKANTDRIAEALFSYTKDTANRAGGKKKKKK